MTLVDDVGGQVMTAVRDGEVIRIDGATVYLGDEVVGTGVIQSRRSVDQAMEDAKNGIATQLEALSANAVEHLRHERDLLLDGVGVPLLATPMQGPAGARRRQGVRLPDETSRRSSPTCGRTRRSSSASTAVPMPCSRPATAPT